MPTTKTPAAPTSAYFSQSTEDAIIKYITSDNDIERNLIFNNFIYKPFNKLVEYHMFKSGTYKFLDSTVSFHHDAITFLCERLQKYKKAKGHAYSYFNVIVRNHVWNETKKLYKKIKSSDTLEAIDDQRNVLNEMIYSEYQDEQVDFMTAFIKYLEDHLETLYKDPKELIVIDSVLELFKKRENIEDFNKKALYILIRERTNLKTTYITKIINEFKFVYEILYKNYQNLDRIKLTPAELKVELKKRKSKLKIESIKNKEIENKIKVKKSQK